MKVTLLAGPPGSNWRPWLKEKGGAHLILDPASSEYGFPGRSVLAREGKQAAWRFLGSLDAARSPLLVVQALEALTRLAGGEDLWVQLFPLRPSPVNRQLALACAQMLRPTVVLVPAGSGSASLGWPVGAEEVELEKPPPPAVPLAQRKARWIELWDKGDMHEIPWTEVQMEGSRLGSGTPVEARGDVWAEKQGSSLFLLAPEPVAEPEVERLLLQTNAAKPLFAPASSYKGLVCSFSEQDGSDFAMGVVQGVDVQRRTFHIRSKAVAPAPVRILRLGTLKISRSGDESEDSKPWSF